MSSVSLVSILRHKRLRQLPPDSPPVHLGIDSLPQFLCPGILIGERVVLAVEGCPWPLVCLCVRGEDGRNSWPPYSCMISKPGYESSYLSIGDGGVSLRLAELSTQVESVSLCCMPPDLIWQKVYRNLILSYCGVVVVYGMAAVLLESLELLLKVPVYVRPRSMQNNSLRCGVESTSRLRMQGIEGCGGIEGGCLSP